MEHFYALPILAGRANGLRGAIQLWGTERGGRRRRRGNVKNNWTLKTFLEKAKRPLPFSLSLSLSPLPLHPVSSFPALCAPSISWPFFSRYVYRVGERLSVVNQSCIAFLFLPSRYSNMVYRGNYGSLKK